MDSQSILVSLQDRLRPGFQPILENARRALRQFIEKKGKVAICSEGSRSADTQAKVDQLEDLMGQVDAYLDEIFEAFIAEVAIQHYEMLRDQ